MVSLPSSSSPSSSYFSWLASSPLEVDCLCVGTGRFLRSVLTPALVEAGLHPAFLQTRGRSMLEYMHNKQTSSDSHNTYEVDTVLSTGQLETQQVPCFGAFTLGSSPGKQAVWQELLPQIKSMSIIGVGVTEAGLASPHTQTMQDVYELLQHACALSSWRIDTPHGKICVINMDNVPNNGQILEKHMHALADERDDPVMKNYLQDRVVFLDTMVDRITSARDGSDGMVPKCEPIPAKALVILDPNGDLPLSITQLPKSFGVVVRTTPQQLQADIALKLCVANGTHTALAHAMALSQILNTNILSCQRKEEGGDLWMSYVDSLFQDQILPGASSAYGEEETRAAYQDWRARLCHAHFGLSTFFITQNGAQKGGIRLGPTVCRLVNSPQKTPVSVAMVYALAAILRWLTPSVLVGNCTTTTRTGIYRGWIDRDLSLPSSATASPADQPVLYADGMHYDLNEGWYEFQCACLVSDGLGDRMRPLSDWLRDIQLESHPQQPQAYIAAIRAYLLAPDGGNLGQLLESSTHTRMYLQDTLVPAVATLYARMVAGDGMIELLQEMAQRKGVYRDGFATDCSVLLDGPPPSFLQQHGRRPLHYRESPIPNDSKLLKAKVLVGDDTLASVVISEVSSALAIDLHTHLLPPSHASLCCWGIDELLTYHYLVAEYFMTAPSSMTPEKFYAMSQKEQANIIWQSLFLDRSPISEACRGVVTTLIALGLSKEVEARDLDAIRSYYMTAFGDKGGAEAFSEFVFSRAGVQYAVMTNIPFDSNEAQHWRPQRKEYPRQYRSALRVDPLLAGDRVTVENALRSNGYDVTLEGARQYLRDWCDTMHPEYMMASTPHDFALPEGTLAGANTRKSVNEEAMKQPFAFVDVVTGGACDVNCDNDGAVASVINENSDFLEQVLMKVCEERDLPIALKIGAHRGVNPKLKTAGDGMVAFADADVLARLCSRFPKVRFLATFLSRNNQQEACVLASKFRNLHLYGCWWFCNNPSLIQEITRMRVEMLGTAFTAQHSDARVLDQLIYKWAHSRSVIAGVLAEEYAKMLDSGWTLTRAELRRDVKRLFGGSYEEFMSTSLA